MLSLFESLSFIGATLALAHLLRRFRTGNFGILTVILTLFTASNILGVSLLRSTADAHGLLTGDLSIIFDEIAILRQIAASWIMLILGLVIEQAAAHRSNPSGKSPHLVTIQVKSIISIVTSLIVFSLGLVLYWKYMVAGPGLEHAASTRFDYQSFDAASEARIEVRESLELGQGYMRAIIASWAVLPLASLLALKAPATRLYGLTLALICFLLSFAFGLSTRQKAPLLIPIAQYAALIITTSPAVIANLHRLLKRSWGKYAMATALAASVALTALYMRFEGDTFEIAAKKAVTRMVVVPAATANMWFATFPDFISFRGILRLHGTASSASGSIEDLVIEMLLIGHIQKAFIRLPTSSNMHSMP